MTEKESRRIGVMHVVDTLDGGGAERMAVNLVNHLPRDHYRPYLCTTRREGVLSDAVAGDVERLSLRRSVRFDLAAIRKLARFAAEHNIKVLHAHNTSLFISLAASLLPPFPAVIWHHHTGRYALEDRAARVYRMAAPRISGVITVTQDLAEWTERRLGLSGGRVRYIPNFVSLQPQNGNRPELPGTPGARVVCVANIHADKDHSTLFRAMKLVIERFPQAFLLLVGEGRNAEYLNGVMVEMVKLGLINNVMLLGQRNDVAKILSACDIGVLSSVSEGLPMALIEYGMAGLPAIATEVGQCPDVLDQGQAGLLVPPSRPEKLAEAIVSLLDSYELRRELGEKFKRRASELYSPNAVIAEICRMYDMVLNHHD